MPAQNMVFCRALHDSHNVKLRRRRLLGAVLACGLMIPCQAQAQDKEISRRALVNMARQLVDSVDYNFERANNYLNDIQGRENFKAIPDGEILLMEIAVNGDKGLAFAEPVLGLKQGEDILLSLYDFVNVAQFAINVKPDEKIAEGWFIREHRKFKLDGHAMTISADDRTYPLAAGDVQFEDSDILVRGGVLAQVFMYQGKASLRYQRLSISTSDKWPAIERLERLRRLKGDILPPPSAPRLDDPYQWISIPSIDVSTVYEYSKDGEKDGRKTEAEKKRNHNIVMNGDFLKHSTRVVTSGDEEHPVQTASAILSRQSDENNLLGPLKAREYQFGDVSSVSVPGGVITGGGVGMRVTNKSPLMTTDDITILEGDIPPGWDAELYRGLQMVDSLSNVENGRYRFENVYLSAGENMFRVLKFGPMGEVQEEEIPIYSTPALLATNPNIYDVSVNLAETKLWTREPSDDQDKYTPIVAGTWERRVGSESSVKAGLATAQADGQQKTYLHLGGATYIAETVLNAGLSADVDGSVMGSIAARRRILEQEVRLAAEYTGADYGSISDAEIPSKYGLDFNMRGGLPRIADFSLGNYSLLARYEEDETGTGTRQLGGNWAYRMGQLAFNHSLRHNLNFYGETDVISPITGLPMPPRDDRESFRGVSSVMGTLWRTRWRASVNYDLDPAFDVTSYNLELNRHLVGDFSGRLVVSHKPEERFTEGEAQLKWNHEDFTLTPGIKYNTDRDLTAYVSANFSLAYDPYSSAVEMSYKKLSETGGISAFVFLDKDGDLVFSEGDEPIQDAVVSAIHSRRRASTDETGQAFIYEVPDNVLTDVALDETSLFDPYMVAASAGRSLLPRAGHTSRIELPVHNGGELDGNVYIAMQDGKDRSAKNLRVNLYHLDGRFAQSATVSFDGFYLFQKIHPGQYWLLVDSRDAQNQRFIRPLPQKLTFGYEGTIIYGHKIVLRKAGEDQHDVPTTIGEDYAPYLAANPDVNVNAIKGNLVLNFGEYRSRALMSVVWYKLKMFNAGAIRDATLLTSLAQSNPAAESGLHALRAVVPGLSMEEAWNRCYGLISKGIGCKVEMLPTGLAAHPHAGQQAQLNLSARG